MPLHNQQFTLSWTPFDAGVQREAPGDTQRTNKVYKVYKDKAFSQELRLLACS